MTGLRWGSLIGMGFSTSPPGTQESEQVMAETVNPQEERDALLRKWNPPPEDHAMGRVLGTPVPEGDTRATNHEPMDVMNQHILAGTDYSDDADDEDDLPDDYDEWTNEQLRNEIKRRNEDRPDDERMTVSGRHAELVERLEADDEDDEEDDEE